MLDGAQPIEKWFWREIQILVRKMVLAGNLNPHSKNGFGGKFKSSFVDDSVATHGCHELAAGGTGRQRIPMICGTNSSSKPWRLLAFKGNLRHGCYNRPKR
jgi:hypothetical protein